MEQSSDGLFASIPRADKLNLFDGSRPKGQEIVGFLDLKKRDVASATKLPEGSVRYDLRMPDALRDWLTELATALNLVAEFFKDATKTNLWFKTPNPMLGNIPPIEMIRMGR